MTLKIFWSICSAFSAVYATYLLVFEKDIQAATFAMVCAIGLKQ